MKKFVRWLAMRVFRVRPVVVRPQRPGTFHFRAHIRWWATREDVYAAVAKARADGIIAAAGPIGFDEAALPRY